MRLATRGAVAGAVATLLLAGLAARADQNAVGGHTAQTLSDIGVGLAFVVAGLAATGPWRQRLVIAAVGPAWLVGSLFQSALSLHQAVLSVALLAAPAGSMRGPARLTSAALGSVLIAAEVVPQPAVAGYFLVVAGVAWLDAGRREPSATFAGCAAIAIAVVIGYGWWAVPRGTSASTVLSLYEAVLVVIAVGLAATTWLDARGRARLADQVLESSALAGLEGLRQILAEVLSDDDLQIALAVRPSLGGGSSVPVYEGDVLVAEVTTRSAAMADGPTASAVATAIRLTVANLRLTELQAQQVLELEASRVRLLAAVDRERQRVAVRLRAEAGLHLEQALAELAGVRRDGEPAELVRLLEDELTAASAEVERLVAGAAPTALGDGQLRAAIAALAARSPVPVVLDLAADARASAAVETALFYVCSEALTNIARHSGAQAARVVLRRLPDSFVLAVRDTGRGGADGHGSGIQGLRDRMAALGGTLVVADAAEGGTAVTATVPTR